MIRVLPRWLERRLRDRRAVVVAVRHFEASTGHHALRFGCSVIGEDARGAVVRVCFARCKPPRGAWYVVAPDGAVVTELVDEEVGQYGEIPQR